MQITKASQLVGVIPALFTPLKNDDPKNLRNSIDYKKLGQMIDDQINAHVTGILPVGTTGQSATVTHKQHLDVIKFTLDYVNGRVPVIAGAGSNCTRESIEVIEEVLKIAEVPVLCVTGYYNNPTQEGIETHFKTLSSETGAKIIIYNVPGRTASYIQPDTLIRLSEDKNIIGLKQAVDFSATGKYHEDTKRVIDATKENDFAVMSGEDGLFIDMLKMGGTALVSATANIAEAAKIFMDLYNAFLANDLQKCAELKASVQDYVDATFCRKNPIPLGALFNSPLYQPMSSVKETANGADAYAKIMKLIDERAQSLKKYQD